ncbi:protein kinase domain-containing protein [Haliangium sp.]|uniref:protein kinase domain-containing protein n=1 Tax=Haliangium sp. TaxID=2663208 RepID=UPI003D122F03
MSADERNQYPSPPIDYGDEGLTEIDGYVEHMAQVDAGEGYTEIELQSYEMELTREAGTLIQERYRIVERVARGGMSVLYKAEQIPLGRIVALKVMVPHPADADAVFEERFLLEAQATAQLTHPNTVVLHDYGRTEVGAYFIAMEFLHGRSLDRAIEEDGPFPQERAVHVGVQICGSLAEAHQRGLVHRDLKPMNVFLTERGDNPDHIKVLDFGLVKVMGGKPIKSTRSGALMGTPAYMPPEQIQGGEVDARSDVYAFGALMFELLTGQPPFGCGTEYEVLSGHMNRPVPAMREVFPVCDVDAGLEQVIRRCLEKDPAARFASIAEVAAELRAFLERDSQRMRMPWTGSYAATPVPSKISSPGAGALQSRPGYGPRSSAGVAVQPDGGAHSRWLTLMVIGAIAAAAVGSWALFGGSVATQPASGDDVAVAATAEIEATRVGVVERPDPAPPARSAGASGAEEGSADEHEGGSDDGAGSAGASAAEAGAGTAAAAPAAPVRSVRIASRPAGASVRRAGRDYGVTPVTVEIPAGEQWSFRVLKDGYQAGVARVLGERDEVTIALQPVARRRRAAGRARAARSHRTNTSSSQESSASAESATQAERKPPAGSGEDLRSITENPDPWED